MDISELEIAAADQYAESLNTSIDRETRIRRLYTFILAGLIQFEAVDDMKLHDLKQRLVELLNHDGNIGGELEVSRLCNPTFGHDKPLFGLPKGKSRTRRLRRLVKLASADVDASLPKDVSCDEVVRMRIAHERIPIYEAVA